MAGTNKKTSRRIAKIAGEGLKNPKRLTLKEIKELAGSALAQARRKLGGKKR